MKIDSAVYLAAVIVNVISVSLDLYRHQVNYYQCIMNEFLIIGIITFWFITSLKNRS